MKIGNTKLMTEEEIKNFESSYDVSVKNGMIDVTSKTRNMHTMHFFDKSFSLLNKNIRRITFTPFAMQMWRDNFLGVYSLFRVQNAVNSLVVIYQEPTVESVKKYLSR